MRWNNLCEERTIHVHDDNWWVFCRIGVFFGMFFRRAEARARRGMLKKKGTRSSLRVWLASRTCRVLDSHLSLFAGLNKLNVSLFPNVISLARYLNSFRRIGNKGYLVRSRFPALLVVCLSSPRFLIGSWWRKPFLWVVHDDANLSYD